MEITVSLDSSFNVPATTVVKSSFSFIKQIPDILFHPSLNTSANTVVLLYRKGIHSTNPQFSSVAQSCSILYYAMNCSTPGLPVHHQFPEFTQTHVHRIRDALQPSHPLSAPSPPALNPSQHPRVFSSESTLRMRWPKYWSFSFSIIPSKEHPGLISFRMDWLDLRAVQRLSRSSPTPQFKSINSSALSFLHSPTLTSIHDHWKNHSLD